MSNDNINHPPHYTETIDFILSPLWLREVAWNVTEHITRYKEKGKVEDLQKAKWFLEMEIFRRAGVVRKWKQEIQRQRGE